MNHAGKILGAAATGFLAGVIAGILFAPKSGEETRDDLARMAGRMKADIENKLKRAGKVTREAYNDAISSVINKYETAEQITEEEADRLKEKLSQGYDEMKESIQTAQNSKKTNNI